MSAQPSPAPGESLLATYLNDHLAGATGGLDLFRWVAGAHRGTPAGDVLAQLAREVEQERAVLLEVMRAVDARVRHAKVLGGWLAEKVLRFTVHGGFLPRSPLSTVLELESLHLAVLGKRAAWQLLRALAEHDDRLDAGMLEDLARRAEEQAAVLDDLRITAARVLLPHGRTGP